MRVLAGLAGIGLALGATVANEAAAMVPSSADWPKPTPRRGGALSFVAEKQQQQSRENFTHEENGIFVDSYPPWCPAKGCNWAQEQLTREQLDNNTALDPAVILFYVTRSEKGQALKPIMTKVSHSVNTKHFNKGSYRPPVRFFTFDMDGHQAIAQAYGVKYDGHPQIIYFPGGKAPNVVKPDGSPGKWIDSRWHSVVMDDDLVMRDVHRMINVTQQDGSMHEQQQQSDELGKQPMEDHLENFVRTEHAHAFGGVHVQGRHTWEATEDERAGIPANCDGDECNDLDCPTGYHTQVVLVGGKISVGDCTCQCHPDSMFDPAVVSKDKGTDAQQGQSQQNPTQGSKAKKA